MPLGLNSSAIIKAGLENKVCCAKVGGGGGKASVTAAASSSSKKSTRKDKGKPRFTAYMLWAKAGFFLNVVLWKL